MKSEEEAQALEIAIQQSVLDGVELTDGMAEEMRKLLDQIEEDSNSSV
jgi:hypothetical protein